MEIKDTGEAEPSIVWDTLSSNSRKEIISWRTHTKKEKQLSRMHLDKKSTGLEIQHEKKQCPKILNETKKTLNEINLLHTQEIEKTFVFAKQKHYEASPKQRKQKSRKSTQN